MTRKLVAPVAFFALTATLTRPASAVQFFAEVGPIDMNTDWTNYLSLADLDGDGDPELVVPNCSGFFSNPGPQPFRVYRDNGGTYADATAQTLGMAWTTAARVAAIGDVDGDGDLDLFVPSASGATDRLFINGGTGVFSDESQTRLPVSAASHSGGARFGDVDGDGDLDLFVAQGYAVGDTPFATLYLNDGDGIFTDATANLPASGPGSDPDDVDFVDIDRDFDIDVLINTHSGPSSLWQNDGNGVFSDVTGNLPGQGSALHYGPSACDVDGDGDLDIWIDNAGPGYSEQLLINDGSGHYADQTSQRVSGNPGADDNGVMCVDVDGDGDFDAVIPSLSDNERILRNDGGGNFDLEPGGFSSQGDPTLWIDFADINDDGRIDAVTGQGEGQPRVERLYYGTASVPVDVTGPKLVVVEDLPDTVPVNQTVIHYAVSDESVTDIGPRLSRAYASMVVNNGAPQEVPASFMGGDLFRAQLPALAEGDAVDLSVCAVDLRDNETCSPPQSFVVGMSMGDGGGGMGGAGSANGGASAGGSPPDGSGGSSASGREFNPPEDCSCTLPGRTEGGLGALALGLGALAFRLRRRK
jgi:VCBS repeat protein